MLLLSGSKLIKFTINDRYKSETKFAKICINLVLHFSPTANFVKPI